MCTRTVRRENGMNKNTIILTLSHLIRIYSSCEGRRGEEGRGEEDAAF